MPTGFRTSLHKDGAPIINPCGNTGRATREKGRAMENISRRNFVGLAGAAAAAMGAGVVAKEADAHVVTPDALLEVVEPQGDTYAEGMLDLGWTGTPEDIQKLGGSTMPLAELNRRRKAYIDQLGDYTMEDGTVVPAVYNKMRGVVHAYGMGCGNTPNDATFIDMMAKYTEDEAQAFVDMPMGIKFTALDFAVSSGRSEEECQALCDKFAADGWILHSKRPEGDYYHQVPFFQGVVEYHLKDVAADPLNYMNPGVGADMLPQDMATTGTPTFYAMPVNKDVVADESGILPYDDIERIIRTHENGSLAIAPCYCRWTAMAKTDPENTPSLQDFASGELEELFSPVCNQRVETCLMLGEEADYWVELGYARYITADQAIEYMKRSVEDGFILESNFAKYTGTVCSCHADSCGIIAEWMSLGSHEAIGAAKPFEQISHYLLDFDPEVCIKCGLCAERCPMHSITMDDEYNGEGGFPHMDEACFRCGQCAYICPVGARKLIARPAEQNLELPEDFLDDDNMKAAYRFEHGLIW